MTATVGSLVSARGREWVVLPGSDDEFYLLRPLGGGEDDIAGVFADEGVTPARFDPPRPDDLGDDRSARLLRDALRIGFRSSGGPFRCLAGLAVEPRPYQLVPLLLALRQDIVRLLIADDVGIGKTIEAALIAAELMAQGSVDRFAVLCPPSLAEQWQGELREKFGIEAELVLPATVRRLERGLAFGESVFDRHKVTIVSTDFIKADVRRDDFLRAAPELIIVDEAHASVSDGTIGTGGAGGRGRTQRYRLMQELAASRDRHLIAVTATPHSGSDATFRNLIGLLDPALHDADLNSEHGRRMLAQYMVQRRRGDIREWLAETKFPQDRQSSEDTYRLAAPYDALFDDVLAYAHGQVTDASGTRVQQRVRWWSALSLLRALASSPAAAAATLQTRSISVGDDEAANIDRVNIAAVYQLDDDESMEGADSTLGALVDASTANTEAPATSTNQALLREFRDRARAISEEPDATRREQADAKLAVLTRAVKRLLKDGFQPIIFCHFIDTAGYVAKHLGDRFPKVTIEAVTGELPPEERAERIRGLASRAGGADRILVATDCLSEGVNLQQDFQAVVHYDLAWNPTRHEQREGRVDRFGQPKDVVRAVTIYGADNIIDKIIMDVLIRKHDAIRRDLGISVPVPASTGEVITELMDRGMRRATRAVQEALPFELPDEAKQLEFEWQSSAEEERRSRSRFAQHTIAPDEVQAQIDAYRAALGSPEDVTGFVTTALREAGAAVTITPGGIDAEIGTVAVGLRDALGRDSGRLRFHADLPVPRGVAVLTRTDPVVGSLARHILDAALDPALDRHVRPARRCGIVVTDAVSAATTLLLVRFRLHLTLPGRTGPRAQIAEEARVLAFTGTPANPTWLPPEEIERLLAAKPTGNTPPDIATNTMTHVLGALGMIEPHLDRIAGELAETLREAHIRVRTAARGDRVGGLGVRGLTVEPQLPADILGAYLYRPGGQA